MLYERIKFTADLGICKVFLKIDNCDERDKRKEIRVDIKDGANHTFLSLLLFMLND